MRKAYLHIGLPKTATTSIQKSLSESRQELRNNGLLYPGDDIDHALMIPTFHQNGGQHFRFARRNMSPENAVEASTTFIAGLVEEFRQFDGDVLISSEYFSDIDQSKVVELRDFFAKSGLVLEIVCYVRHPVAQVTSSLNQRIKLGRTTLEEGLVALAWQSSRITLEPYLSALGRKNLHVRSFNQAVVKGPTNDLLSIVGYHGSLDNVKQLRGNDSLSMAGVFLVDQINQLYGDSSQHRKKRQLMLGVGGQKFQLPAATASLVEERGQEEVAWLKQTFQVEPLGPESNDCYQTPFDEEAIRDIVQLMVRVGYRL